MSTTKISEEAIRVIRFSGKEEDWPYWEEKFLSRARRKGFKEILLGKISIKTETEHLALTDAGQIKDSTEKREKNATAFEELVLSIDTNTTKGRVAFKLVKSCKNSDYPDGHAFKAWTKLINKFVPKSAPSLLKLKRAFNRSKLTSTSKDPDEWITDLEDLREKLENMTPSHTMTDNDLIIHILNNLPKEYEIDVTNMEDRIGASSNALEIDEVRAKLSLRFERLNEDEDKEDNDEEQETAYYSGGFKGKCYKCGTFGHKASDCKKKTDGENSGNSNGKSCKYCKKQGHDISECRILKKKKQQENEQGGMAMTTHEICNRASTFTRNTWIADSGASHHFTNNDKDLIKIQEIDENIQIGNGKYMKATKLGTKIGHIKQSDGKSTKIELKVKFIPELHTNLFSIGCSLKNGWSIGNDKQLIYLKKNSTKVVFDKVMATKDGFISGVEILPASTDLNVNVPSVSNININKAHQILGHVSENILRKTASYYGWKRPEN